MLICLAFPSLAGANVTYRLMFSTEGWKPDKENNADIQKSFCTALNVYEQNFPMYLSQDPKNTALTFYLANLATSRSDTHQIKLVFDDQTILSREMAGLSKPVIKVSLKPNHLEKLYRSNKVRLSVGTLGYDFDNSQILSAKSIIDTCLRTKFKGAEPYTQANAAPDSLVEPDVAGAPAPVPEPESDGEVPVQFPSSKVVASPAKEISETQALQDMQKSQKSEAQAVDYSGEFGQPVGPETSTQKQHEPPLQLSEAPVERFEDSSGEVSDAMKMERQMINNRDGTIELENQVAQSAVSRNQQRPQTPPLAIIGRSYDDIDQNRLSEDERDLFESMKTKMFLLEQEKQAAKSKLTDLRQKEIEVMKIDIGSKQKIAEQAEKIRILQEKLQKYQYRQINAEKPIEEQAQSSDDSDTPDIKDVVDKLIRETGKE